MSDEQLDPFGRPLDTSTPKVVTPEEAKKLMAEYARQDAMSIDELAKLADGERAAAVKGAEEDADFLDDYDALADVDEDIEEDDHL